MNEWIRGQRTCRRQVPLWRCSPQTIQISFSTLQQCPTDEVLALWLGGWSPESDMVEWSSNGKPAIAHCLHTYHRFLPLTRVCWGEQYIALLRPAHLINHLAAGDGMKWRPRRAFGPLQALKSRPCATSGNANTFRMNNSCMFDIRWFSFFIRSVISVKTERICVYLACDKWVRVWAQDVRAPCGQPWLCKERVTAGCTWWD